MSLAETGNCLPISFFHLHFTNVTSKAPIELNLVGIDAYGSLHLLLSEPLFDVNYPLLVVGIIY